MNGRLASILAAWALPACAIATIGLGLAGWLNHGYRFDEALYRAAALFDISHEIYRDPPGSTDWHFLVGRWTGLLTVVGTALAAVFALLQERAVLALARLARHEVIVVGSGGLATKAFEAAQRAGKRAVWVGAAAIELISLRALALPWPPEDHVRAIAGYVAGADHILVSQDDDAGAMALAAATRATAPDAFLTVLLQDALLAEDAAAMISHPRTRFLSVATLSARALHNKRPPFLIAKDLGHERIHALIIGFGQIGQAIAHDLVVNCRTTYLGLPRITVVDPAAEALEGVIRVRAPELDACAQFKFVAGDVGTDGVGPGAVELAEAMKGGGPLTVVYVCRDVDSEGLGAAGVLQSLLRAEDLAEPAIFVRLSDVHTLASGGGRGLSSVIPFGDLDSIIAAAEFLSNAPDQAARVFSEAYRALLPPERRNDPDNRSAHPWDSLEETFRQSTRDVVAHIPAKMASAGIDPSLWLGVVGPPHLPKQARLFSSDAECERLAELEHERWNAQRRMDGWRWTAMPKKSDARRLHPNLVPYDQLSEETKAYDRAIVRETQLICWSSGQVPPSTTLTGKRTAEASSGGVIQRGPGLANRA